MAELFNHLFSWLGASGTVAGIMGGFISVGAATDTLISDDARKQLGQELLQGRLSEKIQLLSVYIDRLFNTFFGESHFSQRCILRSAQISVYLSVLAFLIDVFRDPLIRHTWDVVHANGAYWRAAEFLGFASGMWLLGSVVFDYFNLLKARVLLEQLSRRRATLGFISTALGLDVLTSVLSFAAISIAIDVLGCGLFLPIAQQGVCSGIVYRDLTGVFSNPENRRFLIFFFVGLAPSVWIWASIVATVLASLLSKLKPLFALLVRTFPFDTAPARSIGVVAGVLTSGSYLAIVGIGSFFG